jgi:SAM-dependent methyltransferase
VSLGRWRVAQQYERSFWETQAAQIAAGAISQLDWYTWRANALVEYLRGLGFHELASGSACVIEIGSGPIGIVAHFPGKVRAAVDPLESFYAGNPVLTALRPPGVPYLEGVGENLPCASAAYDLAIIDNCIDHVHDVGAVMREVARVLRPGGLLYLTVNCRTRWGFLLHRALSRLRIDAGHPHTFTLRRVRALLANGSFRLIWFEADSASEARRTDCASRQLKSRLKGVLGTSEFLARLVAQRMGSSHETSNPPPVAD